MMYQLLKPIISLFIVLIVAYANIHGQMAPEKELNEPASLPSLSDQKADKRTVALFHNLHKISNEKVLFGHQDDMAYGVFWKAEQGRSDVKETCGSYPAVFGWDVSKLGKHQHNIDSVNFQDMRSWIRAAYKMGAINTISWHLDNPVSDGDAWDTTTAVSHILPGGSHYEKYLKCLDDFAEYVHSLRQGFLFRHRVPILFRPFHEHTGFWFWWGEGHRSPEEFRILWRFTVTYLREVKGLHNLLFVYSSDIVSSKEEYLECYPGDAYVDVLGIDDYYDVGHRGDPEDLTMRLRMVVEMAKERGKIAALTETGYETIPHDTWWTDVLLRYIKQDPVASKIAYVMVWRNAWPHHHYAPFSGHRSESDFKVFCEDPVIWVEDDLPNLYRLPKQ